MEKISLASYAFHGLVKAGRMDIFGYLETCKYRYDVAADIWIGMLPTLDHDFICSVRDAMDERGLELANLCVDGPHLWMDDPDEREAHHKKALEYMDAAEILGAKTVRLDAGGDHKATTFTGEQMDYIVSRYQEYCQRAYDNGYKFGPENHWGPEVVPENMKAICEAVDHPGFGVLIHFRGEGDELFAPWAMHTHVAWACMENHLNESMNLLKGLGYEGYWGVEHHTGENEYTEVAMQIAAVRDVLNRWRMADKACGCGCGCGCK